MIFSQQLLYTYTAYKAVVKPIPLYYVYKATCITARNGGMVISHCHTNLFSQILREDA